MKQQYHSLPWVCLTRSQGPAWLSLWAHRGSYHNKLKLCCGSIRYNPTTVVVGRQGAINSLHPRPASSLRSAAVCTPCNANVKSLPVRKQRWTYNHRGMRAQARAGPGPGSFQRRAAGEVQAVLRSPACALPAGHSTARGVSHPA